MDEDLVRRYREYQREIGYEPAMALIITEQLKNLNDRLLSLEKTLEEHGEKISLEIEEHKG